MKSSEIHDTLYNFFLDTKLAEKGFVNTKNKELKYDLLYPTGVVLTVEHKKFDNAWSEDIEALQKAEQNKKSTYEWAKDKIKCIDMERFSNDDINFLIECKNIFEAINDYDRIRRTDVSDALWGCVYSLMNACIERNLYSAIATSYKAELEKYRPFNKKANFDEEIVLTWQNFLYSITGTDYRKYYGTDYRKTARFLPEDIRSDITKAITYIGNTTVHRIKCEAAIQGAMISMIEAYEAKNDEEKKVKEEALRNLGKQTNNVVEIIPPTSNGSETFPTKEDEVIEIGTKKGDSGVKIVVPKTFNSEKLWDRYSARDFCCNHGCQIHKKYFNYASENAVGDVYWINAGLDWVNHDWDIMLDYDEDRCFKILHIPANTFSANNFNIKYNKSGAKINLSIDKHSLIDKYSKIDFEPYLVKTIKY